jgi:hypothetical protein
MFPMKSASKQRVVANIPEGRFIGNTVRNPTTTSIGRLSSPNHCRQISRAIFSGFSV